MLHVTPVTRNTGLFPPGVILEMLKMEINLQEFNFCHCGYQRGNGHIFKYSRDHHPSFYNGHMRKLKMRDIEL